MKLLFFKSKWEMGDAPLEAFLERAKANDFDGVELFLPAIAERADTIQERCQQHDLRLIAQIITTGRTPDEHLRSLEESFTRAVDCQPLSVNSHLGRDIFSMEDNLRILGRGLELSRAHNLPLLVETHRARPTYSAIETRRYLERLPELRLTADFSHWMVVHESDLRDQLENIEAAVARSDHIHARIGYEEGPQVPHPKAPEWMEHLNNHLDLWQRIIDRRRSEGAAYLTFTPEFGPPAYMPTLPFTNQPVADTWRINVEMKEILQERLSP